MPVLQRFIQLLEKPSPKVFTPRAHAVADYAISGVFLVGAAAMFGKNKRAAIASLLCGVAELMIAGFTDYPGGVSRRISFPLHRKIDIGFSSMVASMPEFLAFEDEKAKSLFRGQSIAIIGVAVLTEFEPQFITGERERRAS